MADIFSKKGYIIITPSPTLFLYVLWTFIKRAGSIFPPFESVQNFLTAWTKRKWQKWYYVTSEAIIKCNMTSTGLFLYWGTWNPQEGTQDTWAVCGCSRWQPVSIARHMRGFQSLTSHLLADIHMWEQKPTVTATLWLIPDPQKRWANTWLLLFQTTTFQVICYRGRNS